MILLLFGGLMLSAQTPSYTLYPPYNPIAGGGGGCYAYITWQKPIFGSHQGLLGYRIYRDGVFIAQVTNQDTTWCYDFAILSGPRIYSVTAWYDLGPYGYPGYTDESEPVYADEMMVVCACTFPFAEKWNYGYIDPWTWSFFPNQGNWDLNITEGNPPPQASFNGNPASTNYDLTMTASDWRLSSYAYNCFYITLDYDIRLNDSTSSGTEFFEAGIFYNGYWHIVDTIVNTGSFDWQNRHHEFTDVGKDDLKVRFRVFGENSANISSWDVDNIIVDIHCYPPSNLEGMFVGQDVLLTWSPPFCQVIEEYWVPDSLEMHNGNAVWSVTQAFDWIYGSVFDLTAFPNTILHSIDFHHVPDGLTGTWPYRIHVVDWETKTEHATTGLISTTGDDHWEFGISLDSVRGLGGKMVGVFVQPMGNEPGNAYPKISSDDSGPQTTSLYGHFPQFDAMNQSQNGAYLVNLHILIPDSTMNGNDVVNEPEEAAQTTHQYYIYRRFDPMGSFHEIGGPVYDTFFFNTDLPPVGTTVYYYIIAYDQTSWCSSWSDTISMLITSSLSPGESVTSVFPNPASETLKISSETIIESLEIMNYSGRSIHSILGINEVETKIDISHLKPGIYLLKVFTKRGVKVTKVVVL